MFPHTFLCSLLQPGNRNATALVIHVLIDTTFVRVATVAFALAVAVASNDVVVCSHIYRLITGIHSLHHKFQNCSVVNRMSNSTLNP